MGSVGIHGNQFSYFLGKSCLNQLDRRRNKKFFGAAVFQKCCRGILRGEQPLIFCVAKSKSKQVYTRKRYKRHPRPSPLLKYTDRICSKVAQGRWTITQAKAGISPFAGGDETVLFRTV